MVNNSNKTIIIVLLAVFFGLAGGIAGEIFTRAYILENTFNVPFFGDVNLNQGSYGRTNLIIKSPKNVVVEQDTKADETANSLNNSLMAIFKKIKEPKTKVDFTPPYYNLKDELGEAFAITSDGWLLSSFIPPEMKNATKLSTSSLSELKKKILPNYVVIDKDRNKFEADNVVISPALPYVFWHLAEANDLPVRNFASFGDIQEGETVMSYNWDQELWLSTVAELHRENFGLVHSSDKLEENIVLDKLPGKSFKQGWVFDLNGSLLAVYKAGEDIKPIYNYLSCLSCLLSKEKIVKPSLGINYLDLSEILSPLTDWPNKGALIVQSGEEPAVPKFSPATKAGLREGDIILSVNNKDLSVEFSLSAAISQFRAGDEISIKYQRGSDKNTVSIKLDSVK